MSDVYGLLNINQGMLQDFRLLADRVADHQTEKVVNKNISKLKQIEEHMLVDKGLEVAQQSIDEVISKVIRMAPSGNTAGENWTVRELRIVSYYLMKLRDDSINYMYALELLNNNWKNMFFNGLVFYLLNSWYSIEPDFRTLTSQLLMRKLGEYCDSNRRYNLWKNRLNLFDNNGPTRMAAMVSAKKMAIKEAPTLLGFKDSSINQSYYSDVIIKYIANNGITDRDTIEKIFEIHNLDRTKKLVFAYLVEKEDQTGDGLRRAQLCRFANTQLGDVTLATSWAPFTGATETEVLQLKRAMRLVNKWFAQQIIEAFFELCVQDKERKEFWLKYVIYIRDFKIVGSTSTKRLIQNNSKIGSMFLRHYIETHSSSSQTSALVLFFKNKMMVEFSDKGALYAYNWDHTMVKTVTKARNGITSTNDLKIPSMAGLVEKDCLGEYSIYNSEGRMAHLGFWQDRLDSWLKKRVLYVPNSENGFMEYKRDDIFKTNLSLTENSMPQKRRISIPNTVTSAANEFQEQNTASQCGIYNPNFSYKLASKTLDKNVRVLVNLKGFYLSLGKDHYALIRDLRQGEHPIGSIWIKKISLKDWYEIIQWIDTTTMRTIGFIRITTDEVIYKESISDKGKTRYKLY